MLLLSTGEAHEVISPLRHTPSPQIRLNVLSCDPNPGIFTVKRVHGIQMFTNEIKALCTGRHL